MPFSPLYYSIMSNVKIRHHKTNINYFVYNIRFKVTHFVKVQFFFWLSVPDYIIVRTIQILPVAAFSPVLLPCGNMKTIQKINKYS